MAKPKATNFVQVAILEQLVELRAISLKFGPFVENLSKGVLKLLDVLTNPDFFRPVVLGYRVRQKDGLHGRGFL